ncbi:excisionase family DNA-binding protein [Verrucomicrobiota bacterium]
MESESVTLTAAAARLNVHRNTVRAWVKSGRLPAHKDGRRVLIPLAALDAFSRQTCAKCGEPFTGTDARQRFCSPACRWAATYERRKAEHPAKRGPGRPRKQTGKRPPRRKAPVRLRAALDFAEP